MDGVDGPFVVTLEGATELERSWTQASHNLEEETERATIEAGDAAVRAMQERHPYTDRTYNLSGGMHVEPQPRLDFGAVHGVVYEAEIVIPAEYASFVDQGTSRSRPYPFTPRGEGEADRTLNREERAAVDRFERSCKRG